MANAAQHAGKSPDWKIKIMPIATSWYPGTVDISRCE